MTAIIEYGLTQTGFNIKPKTAIVSDIQTTLTSSFGQPLNFTAPSVFSQLIEPHANELATLWELLGAIYASQFPAYAEGESLDGACSYVGLKRLSATASTVDAIVTCDNFAFIPVGSKALLQDTTYTFSAIQNIEVNNEKCYSCQVSINTTTQQNYTIIINNDNYQYLVAPGDTTEMIAAGLLAALAQNTDVTTTRNGNVLTITSNVQDNILTVLVSADISFGIVQSVATFKSDTLGAIAVPIGSLNTIYTPVLSWKAITNLTIGNIGRDTESDIALRARRNLSLQISGSGTKEAVRSRLLAISSVTSVQVLENDTDVTDVNNLPPHSLSAIILGGEDIDIANTLWLAKPGGIQLYGNTNVTIVDSQGQDQIVYFSRAINQYIFVSIAITTSEAFIADSVNTIKQDIVSALMSQAVGQDVIYQSLYQYIYKQVGIVSATIQIGATTNPSNLPVLSSANIIMPADSISTSDVSYIAIVLS